MGAKGPLAPQHCWLWPSHGLDPCVPLTGACELQPDFIPDDLEEAVGMHTEWPVSFFFIPAENF